MNLSFSQFCSAGPEAYATLRRCVDERSRLGGGCEFPDCRMPQGCVPAQAVLGFSRQGNAYLLYWRPAVAYHGSSRVLAALFSRSVWRFDSYESMAGRLLSLRRETTAQPYHPAPLTQERPAPLTQDRPAPLTQERPAPLTQERPAPLTQDRPAPLTQVRPASITAEPRSSVWPSLFCRLRDALGETVLGQDQAVEAAAYRLYSHCGKKAPARPLSLIFYGPTGVGKSELGKALAPALERCTGRRFQLVWTELNTFTQPHSVHRLTGAPPIGPTRTGNGNWISGAVSSSSPPTWTSQSPAGGLWAFQTAARPSSSRKEPRRKKQPPRRQSWRNGCFRKTSRPGGPWCGRESCGKSRAGSAA